jgi:hypothetical protein
MNSNVDEINIDEPVMPSDKIVQFESERAPEGVTIVFSRAQIFE